MEHWLWIILAALFLECKGADRVIQPTGDVIAAVEDIVTLDCSFETSGTGYYLFWYKQDGNNSPKFILSRSKYSTEEENKERFSSKVNSTSNSIPLKIQKLQLSDSAVYYCALQTGGSSQYKLIFGSGTRLNVEPKELAEPDYYKLEGNGTTACLATGFTRQNGTADHTYFEEYFNKTAAVRVGDDKVYNQVALLSDDGDKCEKDSGSEATPCEDSIKPDPTVNFVSVTVLCLRVIFIKTIVFNVLLTFRLWISQ